MQKIHILDNVPLMGKEMFQLLIFTEDKQTIDELVNHSYYAQFIPYKHKVEKSTEGKEFVSFWVDEAKKEELEDLNLLSLGQHNKKWN